MSGVVVVKERHVSTPNHSDKWKRDNVMGGIASCCFFVLKTVEKNDGGIRLHTSSVECNAYPDGRRDDTLANTTDHTPRHENVFGMWVARVLPIWKR